MCPVQSSFYRHTEIMQLKDQQETFWEKGEKVLLGFKVIARQDPKRKKILIFILGLWLNCLLWNNVMRKITKILHI